MSETLAYPRCPLCITGVSSYYHRDNKRLYLQCCQCQLVFVEQSYHLSHELEKAEYDLHQNNSGDCAYRKFLSRLYSPLLERLQAGAAGLDFGCGPGPTLSLMFSEAGFSMSLYDIYYFDDRHVLNNTYDFITATEVVEHLHEPGKVFRQLWSLLPVNGYLGVMTKLLVDVEAFSRWHYKNDPSHVCFYSRECFQYIAGLLNAELTIIGADVIILKKK